MTSHGTKIQWTWIPGYKGETWSPITGCSPVSIGCQKCFAARMVKRFPKIYPKGFDVHLRHDRLEIPLRWKKPRAVFVASMGDIFHDEVVATEFITDIWTVMEEAKDHLFLVLTKRAENMRTFVKEILCKAEPPKNIFLGVTAENQETADERIPILLDTPAAKRFVSVEPMLGPVDLTSIRLRDDWLDSDDNPTILNAFTACVHHPRTVKFAPSAEGQPEGISWVIAGGESGPKARDMDPEWALNLMRKCQDAGVPFFMKQMARREPIPMILNVKEFPVT